MATNLTAVVTLNPSTATVNQQVGATVTVTNASVDTDETVESLNLLCFQSDGVNLTQASNSLVVNPQPFESTNVPFGTSVDFLVCQAIAFAPSTASGTYSFGATLVNSTDDVVTATAGALTVHNPT